MKRSSLYLALAALAVCSCAKAPVSGKNDAAKLYFDSWMHVNYPNAARSALGVYTLDETPGTGAQAGSADSSPYVRVDYVVRDLSGSVGSTNSEELNKQLGKYVVNNYYGPEVWKRGEGSLTAGVDEALSSMRVGGTKRIVVPGWLQTNSRYDTEQDYLANVTGTSAIYEITLRDVITDIKKWETDSVGRYISKTFPGKTVRDSLQYGFYFFETQAPADGKKFSSDTTIYINYVGRLLDGTIFDTNVKDTAKFYGVYSASRTYEPSSVTISKGDDDELTVKMSSSSVIQGFQETILQLGAYAKGIGVFYSTLGYGTAGSGTTIPAYGPLRFDIEVVNKS